MNKKTDDMRANKAFRLMMISWIMGLIGLIVVYIVGQSRGYEPKLIILLRNACLMAGFIVTFFALRKWGYKGDYTLLVLVMFLFSLGQVIQYRLKSDIDAGGPKKRDMQFQKILEEQTEIPGEERNTALQPSTKTKPKDWTAKVKEFVANAMQIYVAIPLGFFLVYFIIKRYGPAGVEVLRKRYFLWAAVLFAASIVFFALGKLPLVGDLLGKFTPWEFFKIAFIVLLAGYLSLARVSMALRRIGTVSETAHKNAGLWIYLGPLLVILIAPQLLFIALKDFGQIILFSGLIIILLFAASKRWVYLLGGALLSAVMTVLLMTLGGYLLPGNRFNRFLLWADLWNYSAFPDLIGWWDAACQMVIALFAFDAGNFLGTGLGLGYPTNIPLAVSDFVYAAIAEELGLFGCLVVVFIFVLILMAGLKTANACRDDFSRLLVVGFSVMITLQAFVNIGGVTQLIPMTGITLPFISRGGFSFAACMAQIGFIMAVSHFLALQREKEHEPDNGIPQRAS